MGGGEDDGFLGPDIESQSIADPHPAKVLLKTNTTITNDTVRIIFLIAISLLSTSCSFENKQLRFVDDVDLAGVAIPEPDGSCYYHVERRWDSQRWDTDLIYRPLPRSGDRFHVETYDMNGVPMGVKEWRFLCDSCGSYDFKTPIISRWPLDGVGVEDKKEAVEIHNSHGDSIKNITLSRTFIEYQSDNRKSVVFHSSLPFSKNKEDIYYHANQYEYVLGDQFFKTARIYNAGKNTSELISGFRVVRSRCFEHYTDTPKSSTEVLSDYPKIYDTHELMMRIRKRNVEDMKR